MRPSPPPDELHSLKTKLQLAQQRLAGLRGRCASNWQLVDLEETKREISELTCRIAAMEHQQAHPVLDSGSGPYVTWIHLSDLHFRLPPAHTEDREPYDSRIVLSALLDDVAGQVAEHHLQPDFIVVTGDVAFSGKSEEYELAGRFFDDLLEIVHLGKERLFIVPGNHDVDRSQVTLSMRETGDAIQDRSMANDVLAARERRGEMMARFQGYAEWTARYLGSDRAFDSSHYYYVHTIRGAGQNIALLGLNSAWLCASDEDEARRLVIGERQIRMSIEEAGGARIKIALMHHPFDCLRAFDRTDAWELLAQACDIVLHGHLHQAELLQIQTPDYRATILAAGACYEARNDGNRYNWVQIHLDAGLGWVHLRRYSGRQGGFWTADVETYRNAPCGVYEFDP